ncbi:hypothetical protein HPB51_014254 [Rhipicephalus microplus]|uniref:Uncharacterized protein n=1 Tax=Rhipicephalus microplus TaxID=6941 RepID=A0A9J6D5D0_RHIMP|nr:hypothetical protein HPB51_014254 [Rhipicephalus microplus]
MEAPWDRYESGDNACAIACSDNGSAVQSTAMVTKLFVNEPDDLPGGKKDTEVCYEAVLEGDEGCIEKDVENVNGVELREVEEEVVEKEVEESLEAEGETEECQRCQERVGKCDGEEAEESQELKEVIESGNGEKDIEEIEGNIEGKVARRERPLKTGKQPAMEVEYYGKGDDTLQHVESN